MHQDLVKVNKLHPRKYPFTSGPVRAEHKSVRCIKIHANDAPRALARAAGTWNPSNSRQLVTDADARLNQGFEMTQIAVLTVLTRVAQ